MGNILLSYRLDYERDLPVETYSRSVHTALEGFGHKVTPIGDGHEHTELYSMPKSLRLQHDLFIDIDCGRNTKGYHHFQKRKDPIGIPSAVWFIDTHGHTDLHRKYAAWYDHIFFAVWARRDTFVGRKSVHWLPNASDSTWFDFGRNIDVVPEFTIGFFGTRGGIDRADAVKRVCDSLPKRPWTYDIREIGKPHKNRWPRTGDAMANCKILFNRGQKHDGPNQRVFESMLMNRPLITNRDAQDGMTKLFEEGEHYLGYDSPSELANQIGWCLTNTDQARDMAKRAYEETIIKHQVKHRVADLLEICNVK